MASEAASSAAGGPDRRGLSARSDTRRMRVSRKSVARFLADAVQAPHFVGQSVAISGSPPAEAR